MASTKRFETIEPSKVVPTEIYERNLDNETLKWLSKQKPSNIPGVDLVIDPDTKVKYLIEGHMRRINALQNNYSLNVRRIISSEADFQRYRGFTSRLGNFDSFKGLLKTIKEMAINPPTY